MVQTILEANRVGPRFSAKFLDATTVMQLSNCSAAPGTTLPPTYKAVGGGEGDQVHAVEFAHAWDDPLEVIAMKGKGTFEYQALLFIPSHTPRVPGPAVHPVAHPVRPIQPGRQDRGAAVCQARLHHGRLQPAHAPVPKRFVNGVVDSQDLSLNVSAESCSGTRRPSGRTDPAGTARRRPIA
jgi:hypothetical protein